VQLLNQTKICGSKFKKAQHIVELALLAPFIMFFIGIVYQIAITIHTNYKFNASLYEAVSFMALSNKIDSTKEETIDNIERYAKILLKERHAPYRDSLRVELTQVNDIDFITGLYRYTSTFTIFNNLPGFNSDDYNYITIIPVNSAILRQNSFEIQDDFFTGDYEIKPYEKPKEDEEENTEGENGNENSETGADTEADINIDTNTQAGIQADTNNIVIPEAKF